MKQSVSLNIIILISNVSYEDYREKTVRIWGFISIWSPLNYFTNY